MEKPQKDCEQLQRLDDPTVGLAALSREITQSRLKIQENIQTGVTGLREENREVRRRQDRMISDLNETRTELRQLLALLDGVKKVALPQAEGRDGQDHDGKEPPEGAAHREQVAGGAPAAEGAAADQQAGNDSDQQGGVMEDTAQQPEPQDEGGQERALKATIEAAYRATQVSGQAEPATPKGSEGRSEDPRVAHGVLLLKAAGVASAELVAHRDTWEWLAALAVRHCHFRTPPAVEDIGEGRIQTVLSGRSLIALLIELWNTRSAATMLEADWALAATAYSRLAAGLTDITGQGKMIRIVLGDGLPPDTDV
ncbi:hypothetical protein C3486_05385 [Streptomyces sp. Ru73]|uniref:hypothetical protein n=1 Tax=Streptomyces sp. Ru73 TaxID=2080748 RepID=UPI000CDDD89B|nr:hypothetical protein [Streptomyces sp. Ru73]POX42439.1 hypothetical protein C3486_05385 [Streptomyces sp. Ru73]